MKFSTDNLYIICSGTYHTYGDEESIYTDKSEAETEAARQSEVKLLGMQISYRVLSLADYIMEKYRDGADSERYTV